MNKRIVIWGAGDSGVKIYNTCTRNDIEVEFFIDKNYATMECFTIPKEVRPPIWESINDVKDLFVLVASVNYFDEIASLLQSWGLKEGCDYVNGLEFLPLSQKHDIKDRELLVYNDAAKQKLTPDFIDKLPLFSYVEIETINRCNGACAFCPVNSNLDTRELKLMPDELFSKIIDELAELDYSGHIAPFSNNEPFLDKRILSFLRETKEKLPKSHLYMFTNGTLLTIDKFIEAVKYLNELIISNYSDDYEFIPTVKDIYQYCLENKDAAQKVEIVKCLQNQQLTTRGGQAPNREKIRVKGITCMNPFIQLVIRPDGKVSLCCNDPFGKFTLGDLNKESLLDIWYGGVYRSIREQILRGRENLSLCSGCDTIWGIFPKKHSRMVSNNLLNVRT